MSAYEDEVLARYSHLVVTEAQLEEFWELNVYEQVAQLAHDIQNIPGDVNITEWYLEFGKIGASFVGALPKSFIAQRPTVCRILSSDQWLDALYVLENGMKSIPEDERQWIDGYEPLLQHLRKR